MLCEQNSRESTSAVPSFDVYVAILSSSASFVRYDAKNDRMVCYASTMFGPKKWILPPRKIEFPAGVSMEG